MYLRTLLTFALLIHHSSSFIIEEQIIFISPEGQKHYLDGYVAHVQFSNLLLNSISDKIHRSLTHALNSWQINVGYLLTNVNARQYILMQLFYSLAAKDYSYSNLLLELIPEKSHEEYLNLTYSHEYMYNIVNNIVEGQSKDLINVPRQIAEEIVENYDFFDSACSEGKTNIVKWLLGLNVGYASSKSVESAWLNYRKDVLILLLEYVDLQREPLKEEIVTTPNTNNETLLHLAASIDNNSNVQILINYGADINAVDSQNRTPLYYAIENNCNHVVHLLIKSGSKLNYGRSLLNIAVGKHNVIAVRLLLDKGASPHPEDNNGINLLRRSLEIIVVTILRDLRKPIENDYDTFKFLFEDYFGLFESILSSSTSNKASEDIIKNQLSIFTLLKRIHSLNMGHEEDKLDEYVRSLKEFVLMKGQDVHVNALVEILKEERFFRESNTDSGDTARGLGEIHVFNVSALEKDLEKYDEEFKTITKSLHETVREFDILSVKNQLQDKYSWKTQEENGLNPMYLAISLGLTTITELFLSDESNWESILDYRDSQGRTPLFFAVHCRQESIVSSLISKGARVDELMHNNFTSLHEAASLGDLGIVELLVNAGASYNALTDNLYAPVHLATLSGHSQVAHFLIEKGADLSYVTKNGTLLHIAALKCDKQVTEAIIESFKVKGGSLSPRFNGYTPFHTAIMATCLPVVMSLSLACNLIPNEKTDGGVAAIHLALDTNNFNITNYLLTIGADSNVINSNGESVLFRLARCNCKMKVQLAKTAIERGAKVNSCGLEYKRPLHMACIVGNLEMVQLLVNSNANINAVDVYERTPLFTASMSGHYAIVYYLISRYANVNTAGTLIYNMKVSPVRVALLFGHQQIANLLRANGATDYVADYTGPIITSYQTNKEGKIMYTTNWPAQQVNEFIKQSRQINIGVCE